MMRGKMGKARGAGSTVSTDDGSCRTKASKPFGRYKEESEKRISKAEVDGVTLRNLLKAWHSFAKIRDPPDFYVAAAELIDGTDCSPDDMQRFCVAMQFEDIAYLRGMLGTFLSAMINTSSHGSFELSLNHFSERIHCLCHRNSKDIRIIGDVGHSFATFMESGKVLIQGSAGQGLGQCMRGGSIAVRGSAGPEVAGYMEGGAISIGGDAGQKGEWPLEDMVYFHRDILANGMTGGSLTIKGDALLPIGNMMEGGEIHVHGRIRRGLGLVAGGRIYNNGKLVAGE